MKLILDIPGRYKVLGEIDRVETSGSPYVVHVIWLRGRELPALCPVGVGGFLENGDFVITGKL